MPKLSSKNDPFVALQREAENAGINLSKAADGRYAASITGGVTLEEYDDPRQLLDDMLALKEIAASDDLYSAEINEFDEAVVTVNGGGTFAARTFAAAFAQAKESVLSQAKLPEPEPEPAKPARSVGRPKRGKTSDVVSEEPPPSAAQVVERWGEKQKMEATETAAEPAKAEVLAPVKPNGSERTQMDIVEPLAEACLAMAQTLTELAGKLRSSETLVPFRGSPYEETETAPLPERLVRNARGK